MRSFVVPCLLGLSLSVAVAACSSKDTDDDNGGASSGGTSASGGSGRTAGTGASGGTSATGGSGASGGSGGSAGASTSIIRGGPFPYPQNKKPQYCTLTTVANASASVQSIYNGWKTQYVVSASPGLRVQRPENNNDTVSEGIGYGMLAAVYMGDQTTFDGLWQYGKAHFDSNGLMNWKIQSGGTVASDGMGSATDADEDMAWALIMASGQWPTGGYLQAAKSVITNLRSSVIAGDYTLKPGDAWGGSNKTFPDYFSPAYLRVFKLVSNDPIWDHVIDRNYEILAQVSGQYGLVPDSTTTAYALTDSYKYDACRTPWRIGMDYCFNGEARAKTYLDKIGGFFNALGIANIYDGYSLTGAKTGTSQNMAFIGPAGVSGMAGFPKLLDDAFAFGAIGNGGTSGYFQQSLRVITMLMMSGNFVDYTKP